MDRDQNRKRGREEAKNSIERPIPGRIVCKDQLHEPHAGREMENAVARWRFRTMVVNERKDRERFEKMRTMVSFSAFILIAPPRIIWSN